MADELERETLPFSPMKPILLVIAAPAFYVAFLNNINQFIKENNIEALIIGFAVFLVIWPSIKVTALMLALRPAVTLTNESITITATGYTIYWTDVKDVCMADSGESAVRSPQSYYVIISVRDPEKYLKAIKNPFTRNYRWITRNWRSTGAFEVDLSLVRGDEDEILHTILRYYQAGRGF